MQREIAIPRPADGQDYAALRQSGTSPARARAQLNLGEPQARRFEKLFRSRTARGAGDSQLPKFARHEAHVATVLAAGGFWAFSERRVGRDGVAVCLPMIAPPKG
ncbi:hypothetical protein BH10PSE5_BH10PSE5_12760 [soil metagenome]